MRRSREFNPFPWRRYVPLLEEYAYQPNTAAMVESFDTVRGLPVRDIPKGATGVGPVDWPAEAPGLRNASSEFYNRCDEVAVDLFRALARVCCMDDTEEVKGHARGVTEAGQRSAAEPREQTECVELAAGDELASFFLESFGPTSHCSMRAMRYPGADSDEFKAHAGELLDPYARAGKRVRTPPPPRRSKGGNVVAVGISEHTDFECFTILHQTAPGLELKDLAGNWRLAEVYQDRSKFTIIIADMMERWTNGWLRATPHRVGLAGHERFSLVRFNGLDPEAIVAPLPRFTGTGASGVNPVGGSNTRRGKVNGAKYTPVTQGEHMAESVTKAADNLEAMLDRYPKVALTPTPGRFAQVLIVDCENETMALVKHAEGEFEGLYTGLITEVRGDETPREAALRGESSGSLRELLGIPVGGADDDDGLHLSERAKLRFKGWKDVPVIEHEFTVSASRASMHHVKNLVSSARQTRKSLPEIEIFRWDEIPYDLMPADDRHWYPKVLDIVREATREIKATDGFMSRAVCPRRPRSEKRWAVERKLVVGFFEFDDAGVLARHETDTIWTDGFMGAVYGDGRDHEAYGEHT
jgi:isopenicillin N synthase-like dioxygenase